MQSYALEVNMPPGFSERERTAIREKLIAIARESLAGAGFAKTSLDEIVAQAGIAKGSFYVFFDSKEALYLEAFESMEESLRSGFFSMVGKGSLPPRKRLEKAFLAMFDMMETNPAAASIDASLVERLARKLPPERIAQHQANDKAAALRGYSAWREAGIVKDVGVNAFMGVFYSIFFLAAHRTDMPGEQWKAARGVITKALARELAADDTEILEEET